MGRSTQLMGDTVRMALGSLTVHKLRSILTMVGITIGVFSVIGAMTAVSALRESIETGLSFLGANTFRFSKWPTVPTGGEDWAKISRRRSFTLADGLRYQQLMSGWADVVSLSASKSPAQAVYAGRKTSLGLNFVGGNESFLATDQYSIALGRNFTGADVELRRPVAIIGQDVVDKLFPSELPLDKRIKVDGHEYTVIGTFTPKGTAFGESQDQIVMVPISRFLEDNGERGYSVDLNTQAPSSDLYNETMDRGITALRIVRGLRPDQENDFEIYSNDSLLAAFAKVADAVRAGALVISAIALVAAGVGIMNIMLVSVTERTKEIGVRKSIGARRADILIQFLLESVTICLAGGFAGILLGVIAGDAVAVWLHASVVFPWGWAVAGVLVCTVIGVGFGFYPAVRAACLDPIEALRYE
jgi:putative ABC transport system permease protein